jgi:hypothetical protein
MTMEQAGVIALESFYAYGFRGRELVAVRAPFDMDAKASGFIGSLVRVGAGIYRVLAVRRQITGPITSGEPIGVELQAEPAAG